MANAPMFCIPFHSAFTTHILTFSGKDGITIRTGFDCEWLALRARRRALANGAIFAFVEHTK